MATVRIYKVAEVLDTTSQDVVTLLKRDHGIEVKSASSTIEEVVARQFVERVSRERGLTLPGGPLFSDRPSKRKGRKAAGKASAKTAEPAKPAPRPLPPPRLVKVKRTPAGRIWTIFSSNLFVRAYCPLMPGKSSDPLRPP